MNFESMQIIKKPQENNFVPKFDKDPLKSLTEELKEMDKKGEIPENLTANPVEQTQKAEIENIYENSKLDNTIIGLIKETVKAHEQAAGEMDYETKVSIISHLIKQAQNHKMTDEDFKENSFEMSSTLDDSIEKHLKQAA